MRIYIDPFLVRKAFDYNKDSGLLTRKGKIAGYINTCGHQNSKKQYRRSFFNGRYVYVHRLIWVYMTGEQPDTVDHIDGNGLNNKWSNLRNVSHGINGKNQKIHTTNTSGTSGVTYRKDSGKWRARIMVDDVPISLGTFADKQEAINARKQAEKNYGYLD